MGNKIYMGRKTLLWELIVRALCNYFLILITNIAQEIVKIKLSILQKKLN